ncbi:MAG: type II toxin-antitoxin system VapC family toxin [Deltaproteobacteria bacterium]|nr:MAG: type II toxin-antitoxin system VapC family toxin [Deltaproteobacteria bacterium]
MRLVDSCGWIEFFTNGPSADEYASELSASPERIVVPTVVLHEVYKFLLRNAGEETALRCAGRMTSCRLFDALIALEGADLAVRHKLAMAGAIVLATASREGAELVTSDADLQGLPSVRFLPKK